MRPRVFLMGFALLASGCAFGDAPLEEVDPEAAPAQPTWSEHVAPILDFYCNACHSPDALLGELGGFGYDTCAKAKRGWGPLWQTAAEDRTMPPGGAQRILPWELLTLERWRAQGARCD